MVVVEEQGDLWSFAPSLVGFMSRMDLSAFWLLKAGWRYPAGARDYGLDDMPLRGNRFLYAVMVVVQGFFACTIKQTGSHGILGI